MKVSMLMHVTVPRARTEGSIPPSYHHDAEPNGATGLDIPLHAECEPALGSLELMERNENSSTHIGTLAHRHIGEHAFHRNVLGTLNSIAEAAGIWGLAGSRPLNRSR